MNPIKFNIAKDKEGRIITIDSAVKGIEYFCPECGGRFILKKSGNTGPGSRRPHFAHESESHNCTPESVLHAAFKQQTAEILKRHIVDHNQMPITWDCQLCNQKNEGDLLAICNDVQIEYDMKACRPDIALLDESGKCRIAIEIVVTHYPEENALKYYKENGIIMAQYVVSEEDVLRVEEKLNKPDRVSLCLNGKCLDFEPFQNQLHQESIICRCNVCGQKCVGERIVLSTALGIFNSKLKKVSPCGCNLGLMVRNYYPSYDFNRKTGKFQRRQRF